MLHAIAMTAGLWLLWLAMTHAWTSWRRAGGGAAVALMCLLASARFGGRGRGKSALLRLPGVALLAVGRVGAVFGGAIAVIGAALAGGARLRPALVRVRQRPA